MILSRYVSGLYYTFLAKKSVLLFGLTRSNLNLDLFLESLKSMVPKLRLKKSSLGPNTKLCLLCPIE